MKEVGNKNGKIKRQRRETGKLNNEWTENK